MSASKTEGQLSFRPMRPADLAQLDAWLAEPHVAEWWPDADDTVAAVASPDRLATDGQPLEVWVMEVDGEQVGFVQWYPVVADDQWWPGLAVPANTVGIDITIGDPERVGKGLGRRLLLEFIHHVVRPSAPEATEVWIDPDVRNERARRSYAAVGFADTGIVLPDPEQPGAQRRFMKLTFPGPAFR